MIDIVIGDKSILWVHINEFGAIVLPGVSYNFGSVATMCLLVVFIVMMSFMLIMR